MLSKEKDDEDSKHILNYAHAGRDDPWQVIATQATLVAPETTAAK